MGDAPVDVRQMPRQDPLVFGLVARTPVGVDDAKQLAAVIQAQVDQARMMDETKAPNIDLGVDTVSTGMGASVMPPDA